MLPQNEGVWRAFLLVHSCRTIGAGGLGGFDWSNVGELLRHWHSVDTTAELHQGLSICESEMLKIDEKNREKKKAARSTRSPRRRARRR